MAKEILAVPEDKLEEIIKVIRAGLHLLDKKISKDTKYNLEEWCRVEEEYLRGLKDG
mgnify:CR=1 FL=1